MSTFKNTLSVATTALSTVNANPTDITGPQLVEAFNNLAKLTGAKLVNKFTNKAKAAEKLEELIEAAKQTEAEVTTEMEDKKKRREAAKKEKAKKSEKKEATEKKPRKARKSLQVTIETEEGVQEPTKMNLIKISTFKSATKITLSAEPSEPQRKHLENMGVLDRMVVEIPPEEATA